MPVELVAEQMITVGDEAVIEGPSPAAPYGMVFEDDGNTGYLYGMDFGRAESPIVDALHIYNVKNITDRAIPSKVQLVWSSDGLKGALMINGYPHAVFDFERKRGYCRTGFPPPSMSWSNEGHSWTDDALELFR